MRLFNRRKRKQLSRVMKRKVLRSALKQKCRDDDKALDDAIEHVSNLFSPEKPFKLPVETPDNTICFDDVDLIHCDVRLRSHRHLCVQW